MLKCFRVAFGLKYWQTLERHVSALWLFRTVCFLTLQSSTVCFFSYRYRTKLSFFFPCFLSFSFFPSLSSFLPSFLSFFPFTAFGVKTSREKTFSANRAMRKCTVAFLHRVLPHRSIQHFVFLHLVLPHQTFFLSLSSFLSFLSLHLVWKHHVRKHSVWVRAVPNRAMRKRTARKRHSVETPSAETWLN